MNQEQLRYWKYIELDNWPTIKAKLNDWVERRQLSSSQYFWNDVQVLELVKEVPELIISLAHLNTRCLYSAVIVAHPSQNVLSHVNNIHVDDMKGVETRLQLPIRNTEGSYTHFYSAPPEKVIKKLLPNGHAFWWVDPADAKHETKVCIDRPTLIRTGKPHSVQCNPRGPSPRIALTLRLNTDLTKWLYDNQI